MAVVDTGASYISGPTSSLRLLMENLGAKELSTNEVSSSGGAPGLGEHHLVQALTFRAFPSSPLTLLGLVPWGVGGGERMCPALPRGEARPQAQGRVFWRTPCTQRGRLYSPLSML